MPVGAGPYCPDIDVPCRSLRRSRRRDTASAARSAVSATTDSTETPLPSTTRSPFPSSTIFIRHCRSSPPFGPFMSLNDTSTVRIRDEKRSNAKSIQRSMFSCCDEVMPTFRSRIFTFTMEPAFSQTLQEFPLFSNHATDSILTSEIDYFKLNHQTIDLSEHCAAVTFLLKYKMANQLGRGEMSHSFVVAIRAYRRRVAGPSAAANRLWFGFGGLRFTSFPLTCPTSTSEEEPSANHGQSS